MVKNPPATEMQETWVQLLGRENSLGKGMATHSSTLAWKIHGQRTLVDYSPWGHKESDMAGQANTKKNVVKLNFIRI